MDGAVIAGNRVEGDVKGPLVITSRQDTATFDSQQASAGGSVTIGYGFSGSGSASVSMAKGDFASVKEQSGIKAGDGGFALQTEGQTVKAILERVTDRHAWPAVKATTQAVISTTLVAKAIGS